MAEGFVRIRSFWSVEQANLAKLYLESHGINVELEGTSMLSMDWLSANAIGGVRLLVNSPDADEAIRLLDESADASLRDADGDDPVNHEIDDDADANTDNEPVDHEEVDPPTRAEALKDFVIWFVLAPLCFIIACVVLYNITSEF